MTELQATEEEAEWLRLIKPQNDQHVRVSEPAPAASLANFPVNSCLFALSNVWGLVFVGDERAIHVHSLPSINTLLTTPKPASSETDSSRPSIALQSITLSSRPVWIRLAMGDRRLVVGGMGGEESGVRVWDVRKVLEGDLTAIHTFPNPNAPLLNLLPNPSLLGGMPHLVLALGQKGLDVLNIKDGESGVVRRLDGKFTCVAWSVKGKQFVAGTPSGPLEQYAPDGTKKAEIPPPPSLADSGTGYQPTSVAWLENDLFLVTFGPTQPDPDAKPRQYLVARQATPTTFTYTEIDEYFLSGFNDRSGQFRETATIKNWGSSRHLAFVIAQSTPEVGILRCAHATGEWSQLDLDENARAALPFQEIAPDSNDEAEETVPLGLEIDLTPSEPIKRPMEGGLPVPDLPPMPRLMVYSSDGVIVAYDIRNTADGSFDGMVVPKDITQAETAAMDDGMQVAVAARVPQDPVAKPAPSNPLSFGTVVPGVKPSFGFGTTKLPSMGTGLKGSPGFGAPTAAPLTFGSSGFGAKVTPAFGSSGFGSGAFGAAPATSTPSVPAPSAFGAAGSAVSAFGVAAKPVAAAFGSSGAFGGPAVGAFGARSSAESGAGAFGGSGPSSFGSTSVASATGAFGGPAKRGAFGSTGSYAFGSGSSPQVVNAFGQPAPAAAAFGGSSFGPAASAPVVGAFGGPAKTSAFSSTGSSAFGPGASTPASGAPSKPALVTGGIGTSPFGSASVAPPTGAFGQPSSSSGGFGSSSFGQKSAFGRPSTASAHPTFGRTGSTSPSPEPSSLFGGLSFGKPDVRSASPFGQSAQSTGNMFAPLAGKLAGDAFSSIDMLGSTLEGDDDAGLASSTSPKSEAASIDRAGSESPTDAKRAAQPLFRQPGMFSGQKPPTAVPPPTSTAIESKLDPFGGNKLGKSSFSFADSGSTGLFSPASSAFEPTDRAFQSSSSATSAVPPTSLAPCSPSSQNAKPTWPTKSPAALETGGTPESRVAFGTQQKTSMGTGFSAFAKGGSSGFAAPKAVISSTPAPTASPLSFAKTGESKSVTITSPATPTESETVAIDTQATNAASPHLPSAQQRSPAPASPQVFRHSEKDDSEDVEAASSLFDEGGESGQSPPSAPAQQQNLSPENAVSPGSGSSFSSSAKDSRESGDQYGDEEADGPSEGGEAESVTDPTSAVQAFTGWGDGAAARAKFSDVGKWECTSCACKWPDSSNVCEACETARPGSKPTAQVNPFAAIKPAASVSRPVGSAFSSLSPQSESDVSSVLKAPPPLAGMSAQSPTFRFPSPPSFRMPEMKPGPTSLLTPADLVRPKPTLFRPEPIGRMTPPPDDPYTQLPPASSSEDKYNWARQEITEKGIAGQFAKTYQDLQQELDLLHQLALDQGERHVQTRRGLPGDTTSFDSISTATRWAFERLDALSEHTHTLEIMASELREEACDLDAELDGLVDTFYRVQLQLAECERLTKARANPGITRRLRVRKLGPVQEREQATLRGLNKAIADKLDEVETALCRLRRRIAKQETSHSPTRNTAWQATQAALRNTSTKIREQQLNIDDLAARVERVDLLPSATQHTRRSSIGENGSDATDEDHPVESIARVSAALNGEAFGAMLQRTIRREQAHLVTCHPVSPVVKIDASGTIVTEQKKSATPRQRIARSQPPPPAPVTGSGAFGFGIAPASTLGLKGLGLGKAPSRSAGRIVLHHQGPRATPNAYAAASPAFSPDFFGS